MNWSKTNIQAKDINWVNALKALCILFVFLRHCESYYGFGLGVIPDSLVSTFYVNGFFFVSGYLLFWKQLSWPKIQEDRKTYIKKGGGRMLLLNILYRIVIPSIIFSAFEFFPSCFIQGREIELGYALYKTIGGGTYWFTSALVVAELVLLMLFCTRKRTIWFYVTISIALGVTGLIIVKQGFLESGFWAWRQGLISLVFLAMGGLFWRYEKQIDRLMRWWLSVPLLFIYVVMVIGLDGYNDPLISTLTIQPLGFVTSAIACVLLVWLCKILPEIKTLTFIGQNSLGFYFMSGALPITFSMIAHNLFLGRSIWMMIAIWIVCLFVAIFAVAFINRWIPGLWDLRVLGKQKL